MAKKKTPAKKLTAKKTAKSSLKKVVKKSNAKKVTKKIAKKATKNVAKKKKKEDLVCFLTTACVHYKGLPDNCRELSTLRLYRDQYLMATAAGVEMVKEYYRVAPQIISKINQLKQQSIDYSFVYRQVQTACKFIDAFKPEEAKMTYLTMVNTLRKKYNL